LDLGLNIFRNLKLFFALELPMPDDLVTVSTHTTMVEAELAKGVLEAAGIEAFIHAPHANALYPGVLGEVMLQVKASDLEKAEEALEEGEVLEE
jgi:hypothetical protein